MGQILQEPRLISRNISWVAFVAMAMVACVGCSGDTGDAEGGGGRGGVDAGIVDAAPDSDITATDAGDSGPEDGGLDEGGSSTLCDPACSAGEVCCTDQHGHFPTCVQGVICP